MYQNNYNLYQKQRLIKPNYITNDEIITLNDAISLIKKSISNEKEDELFYNTLINQAPTPKEKTIISSIRDDERKHNKILRDLYYEFTNQVITNNVIPNIENINLNYKDNLEKALFGELDAVRKYRKIMGAMPNRDSYILLMSIMTDELRHANEYNFLINKN